MDVVKPNSKKNAQGLVGLASSLLQEQLDLSQGPQTEDALIEVLLSLSLCNIMPSLCFGHHELTCVVWCALFGGVAFHCLSVVVQALRDETTVLQESTKEAFEDLKVCLLDTH